MLKSLQEQLHNELKGNILPFWSSCAHDETHGGCYGSMDAIGNVNVTADKSAILHARLLWTYSESYQKLSENTYLEYAHSLYDYMVLNFIDQSYKGVFYQISYDATSQEHTKSTVAQAYAVFAFSAYYQATKNPLALMYAKGIMNKVEDHAKDKFNGVYHPELTRDWKTFTALPSSISPSVYLHLIEAYTVLLKCEADDKLSVVLSGLIGFFIHNIIDKEGCFVKQHFTLNGDSLIKSKRYGHDLEAAWLLVKAAQVLNDEWLQQKTQSIALQMIHQVIKEHEVVGNIYDGGFRWGKDIQENSDENTETTRVAWVQAEAINALSWAYQVTQEKQYQNWLLGTWHYIQQYLIDPLYGDWIESRNAQGHVDVNNVKIGPWKCPYHSVRGCLSFLNLLEYEGFNHELSQQYHHNYHLSKNNKEAS